MNSALVSHLTLENSLCFFLAPSVVHPGQDRTDDLRVGSRKSRGRVLSTRVQHAIPTAKARWDQFVTYFIFEVLALSDPRK